MANLAVTPAQVLFGVGNIDLLTAGEVIDAGEVVYKKISDGKAYLADANVTSAEALALGIAVGSALVAGQKIPVQKNGPVTLGAGAAPVQGQTYVVSETPGKIAAEADIVTAGSFISILGVGDASNVLKLDINNSAIAVP